MFKREVYYDENICKCHKLLMSENTIFLELHAKFIMK